MIPRTAAWKNALACAIRDPDDLVALLELPPQLLPAARRAAKAFPLRVPRGYAALMERGRADDPLLRQVLPIDAENHPTAGFENDPVADAAASVRPGLLHKYAGRVLLLVTGACAVHCRYCFRRHFPYSEANPAANEWAQAVDYIAEHREITEVILSGGDPLLLDDGRLADLVRRLERLSHVTRLRLHSRLPIVLPERVDASLLEWLRDTRLLTVLVTHANHPRELSEEVFAATGALRAAGVRLFNQSVLLRGVNDDADTLHALSERLFAADIVPYYLHLLDRVRGAAHFEVAQEDANALHRALCSRLPGYLVPRLVREVPGYSHKVQLF